MKKNYIMNIINIATPIEINNPQHMVKSVLVNMAYKVKDIVSNVVVTAAYKVELVE